MSAVKARVTYKASHTTNMSNTSTIVQISNSPTFSALHRLDQEQQSVFCNGNALKSLLTPEQSSEFRKWLTLPIVQHSADPSNMDVAHQYVAVEHETSQLKLQTTLEHKAMQQYNRMVERHGFTMQNFQHILEEQSTIVHLGLHGDYYDFEADDGVTRKRFTMIIDNIPALRQLLSSKDTFKKGAREIRCRDLHAVIARLWEEEVLSLMYPSDGQQYSMWRIIDADSHIFDDSQLRDMICDIAQKRFRCTCRFGMRQGHRKIELHNGTLREDAAGNVVTIKRVCSPSSSHIRFTSICVCSKIYF